MFLSNSIIKRLMKQAYKRGLIVAQTEARYYIAGSYWEMDVKKEFLPKQILAQLIELAGEVPAEGTRFSATKKGNQLETELPCAVNVEGFDEIIEVTNLVLLNGGVAQRLLQHETTGDVYIINNAFIAVADNAAVMEDQGEYRVEKPLFNKSRGLLWQNNVARFHASWRSDENHERLLAEITQIDITEDPVE